MNNTIILILLTIISIIFLIRLHKKGNKSEALSFLSTIIATLFGVLLAVTLSNIENQKKERKDTIKLLYTAQSTITVTYGYTSGLGDFDAKINKDSSKSDFREKNPFPYPYLLESIFVNELVSKNIPEKTHSQINTSLINLQRINNYMKIDAYLKTLEKMHLLIQFEIAYLKGNITLKELDVQKIEFTNSIE